MSQIIVGLDIGTSKVSALVASLEENGDINILGLAKSPCSGFIRGGAININSVSESIRDVVSLVQNQSGQSFKRVVVGVAGSDIKGILSISTIATRPPNHEITVEDVERLIEDAKKVRYPSDRVVLHTLPQEFKVDNVEKIKDPVGLVGVRVEAKVHIVTATVSLIENFRRTISRAGLEVDEFVFQPLASAYSVLEPEEKEIGVALIDIGAGTTDVAVFEDGVLKYTGSLPIAGERITLDIRKAFRIQRDLAEELKMKEGYAYLDAITEDKAISVQSIGGREPFEITRSMLCQVIQPRVEEIFDILYMDHLKKEGFSRSLSAGIVLTGGTALLKGITELAKEKFEMPVRLGIPMRGFTGGFFKEVQNPIYSTVAGLVLYRAEEIKQGIKSRGSITSEVIRKLKEFFRSIFS